MGLTALGVAEVTDELKALAASITDYLAILASREAAAPLLDPFLKAQKAFNPTTDDFRSGRVEFIEELPRGTTPRIYDRIWTDLKTR